MTKSSSALMSLVAAVPGGFLTYILVMAFFQHANVMSMALNVVVGVTLLCSIAAALMPVGILIFGGPKGGAKSKAVKATGQADDGDQAVGQEEDEGFQSDPEASDAFLDSDDSGDLLDESDAGEPAGLDQDSDEWDVGGDDLSDEFEFDDALSDDDMEFDFDDEEK